MTWGWTRSAKRSASSKLTNVDCCAASEGALNLRDPKLGIDWPLPIGDMSERDRTHPMLTAAFAGIDL